MFTRILRVSSWGIPAVYDISHRPIFFLYWNCFVERWFEVYSDCYCTTRKDIVKWVKLYCLDTALQNSHSIESCCSVINQRGTNGRWRYAVSYCCFICGSAHPTCLQLVLLKNLLWLLGKKNHKSINHWKSSFYVSSILGYPLQIFVNGHWLNRNHRGIICD